MNKKLTKKKINALLEIKNKFSRTGRMWETGSKLPTITCALAEVLGDYPIQINVPYAGFNCKGAASIISEDVCGMMPFSSTRKNEDECSTLFYGDRPIHRGNYIPFQSCADCFHISDIHISFTNEIVIDLIKGNNSNMFM